MGRGGGRVKSVLRTSTIFPSPPHPPIDVGHGTENANMSLKINSRYFKLFRVSCFFGAFVQ